MNETQVTVVGTLITAVDKRRLLDGTTVVSFRVASHERRFDKTTESWTDGDSFYTSVTAWRRLGEHVHASFVLGDPIIVRGRLVSRNYDDKEGRRHAIVELEASAVGPDLSRCTAVVTRVRKAETGASSPSSDRATGTTSGAAGESGGAPRPAAGPSAHDAVPAGGVDRSAAERDVDERERRTSPVEAVVSH